jgi:hypothetical protein
MIKVKDSKKFDLLLKGLADDIVDSHMHDQLYKDLRQALFDYPMVANESNTFLLPTLNAHINYSLQTLYRVLRSTPFITSSAWLVINDTRELAPF